MLYLLLPQTDDSTMSSLNCCTVYLSPPFISPCVCVCVGDILLGLELGRILNAQHLCHDPGVCTDSFE
jgi:hypothetical protein